MLNSSSYAVVNGYIVRSFFTTFFLVSAQTSNCLATAVEKAELGSPHVDCDQLSIRFN